MRFKDRQDAGKQLCQYLKHYQGLPIVVYALPRGGVVVAKEIADFLQAPLDLVFARKIGHPHHAEYAIAAISENGQMVGNAQELSVVSPDWLEAEKQRQHEEIRRRREKYLKGKPALSARGKIAIIVDDGIATGLTMQAGIRQLQSQHPKSIVVVVPVAPKSTVNLLKTMVDDVVTIGTPDDHLFLGAVGAYYDHFDQVEDEEVIEILESLE